VVDAADHSCLTKHRSVAVAYSGREMGSAGRGAAVRRRAGEPC
jgi:hypothetical protein